MLRVVALKFCHAGAYVPWHLGTRCRMVDVVIVGGTWIGTGFVLSVAVRMDWLPHGSFSDRMASWPYFDLTCCCHVTTLIDRRGLLCQRSELVTWICCSDANCHGRRIENGIIA
jgi:hypothetical protein